MKNTFLIISLFVATLFNVVAQDTLAKNVLPEVIPVEITNSIFHNISAKSKEAGAKISWSIDYDVIEQLKNEGYSIVLKYNTKIGDKRHKAGFDKSDWTVIDNIAITETSYTLKELNGGDKYVYKIGVQKGDEMILSEKKKFKTKREWGIFKLLVLIGALGMFIYGMKVMSEGLQKAAGSRLRKMLASITSNRFKGVMTGFGITALVQSSSVTTVMTVSFVNAGLLTLVQSAGVMMGANIGTTITAWLINIFGFKVSMAAYAYIIIAIGAPFMFFGRSKAKAWAGAIIGFALLFMGLGALKSAVPGMGVDSPLVQFFAQYAHPGYMATLMFVGLGTIATVIIQSSSAAMALTMTMVAAGIIPFEVAAAMILGENIGTTITAELASMIGNVHAKRSARIHSLFNIVGVTWAVLLFPFLMSGIHWILESMHSGPDAYVFDANTGLATFHTLFNLLNVLLLIGFVPVLVRLAERTVKSKGGEDEEYKLEYIGTGMMNTPAMSILEAKKEIIKFGGLTSKMNGFVSNLIFEKEHKVISKTITRVAKYEEITDNVESEIADYLAKVSKGEMSTETSVRIRGMLSIIGDLERIGDIYYQMSKEIERKVDNKIWFTPEQREALTEMFDIVEKSLDNMNNNLTLDYSAVSITKAKELENQLNSKRDAIKKQHFKDIEKGKYSITSAGVYSNLFHSLEKIGDHVINVTEGLVGEV